MLLKTFYEVVDSEVLSEQNMRFKVLLHPNHNIYKGHFPQNPITPGVGLLQILKELLEFHFKTDLMMPNISMVKFLALVNPNEHDELHFNIFYTHDNKEIKVKNETTFNDGKIVLKCNATFVETNLISNQA